MTSRGGGRASAETFAEMGARPPSTAAIRGTAKISLKPTFAGSIAIGPPPEGQSSRQHLSWLATGIRFGPSPTTAPVGCDPRSVRRAGAGSAPPDDDEVADVGVEVEGRCQGGRDVLESGDTHMADLAAPVADEMLL